jgi:ADP-heptose:LPS heptosyltransferase
MIDQPGTVLVYVGLDLVGDGVMKLPFVASLRALYPCARITWLAGQGRSVYAGSLAPMVKGLLDEVIDQAGIGLGALELWRRPLPGRSFDLILDSQRRVMTSLILRRIRHRRFISAAADWRLSDAVPPSGRQKPPAMLGQMRALLEAAAGTTPPPPPPLTIPIDLKMIAGRRLPVGPRYVGLAPGAGGKHKCWPLDHFRTVAAALLANGSAPVFFLGPAERAWERGLRGEFPSALFPLTDEDAPPLTIALAANLTAALANDSGTGHMLAAGGAPLVSLFGPTAPEKFAPTARKLTMIRAQQFGGDDMALIPPAAVIDALTRFMESRS